MTRYHGWLALKLLMATALLGGLYAAAGIRLVQFTFDEVLIKFWMLPMLWVALLALAIRDGRLRCRSCARRLRMPLAEGSYSGMLLDHPQTEYVCPYGHGKLRVQASVSARPERQWTRQGDIWEELTRPASPVDGK